MKLSSTKRTIRAFTAFSAAVLCIPASAEQTRRAINAVTSQTSGSLTVKVDQPGVKINPLLYGLMTEEINHSYDGGLYAELIQNRVLKDNAQNPVHWSAVTTGTSKASIALDTDHPADTALTASLRLDISAADAANRAGAANDGYWGIPVKPNTTYKASFYARAEGGFTGPVTAAIESNDSGTVFASAKVLGIGAEWKKYTLTLKTGNIAPSLSNRLVISAASPGTLKVTEVSLFPPTYNNTPNGNRIDLMQKLAGMNPSFLRLPGGNYLEGNTIAERFDWKKTIGQVDQRPGHQGPWGYRSTDGLGLYEFLMWCEDLKMEPLLAVYGGYSLGGEHVTPGPDLIPYVQDALDEIEYLTGDPSTKWGAERARAGHPKPFKLTYVEVGNEDWIDRSGSYDGRFAQFYDAIRAKYPKLKVIATANVKGRTPDLIDEHFYRTSKAMARDAHHYDNYDRKGPHIFVGEWASQDVDTPWADVDKKGPTPSFSCALGDAAWLTGLERNSDIVDIEAYAPLQVNINPGARQWAVNLIGYDALNSFVSPAYYVQSMFGNNRGDTVLPVSLDLPGIAAPTNPHPTGKVGVGTWRTAAEFKDIKVTHNAQTLYAKDFASGTDDWKTGAGTWKVTDGALQETVTGVDDSHATAGSADWTDYIYHLKARKISGREGFLILFRYKDDQNWVWWNIGGWGNTRSTLQRKIDGEQNEFGNSSPTTVETGKWYDIRVEVSGTSYKCYLDDKLVNEAEDVPPPAPSPIYTTASRDTKTGDIILKVVNVESEPKLVTVNLQGAKDVAKTATAIVLTGNPADMNSIEEPEKVAPKTVKVPNISNAFPYEFPGYSVTVLRVKAK